MDRAARCGIRMIDLMNPDVFALKLKDNLNEKNPLFKVVFGAEEFNFEKVFEEYRAFAKELEPFICDLTEFFYPMRNKSFLFEGAQEIF